MFVNDQPPVKVVVLKYYKLFAEIMLESVECIKIHGEPVSAAALLAGLLGNNHVGLGLIPVHFQIPTAHTQTPNTNKNNYSIQKFSETTTETTIKRYKNTESDCAEFVLIQNVFQRSAQPNK